VMTAIPHAAPGSRFADVGGEIWATIRVEITMQWRRSGFWVTFAFLTALLVLLTVQGALFFKKLPPDYFDEHIPTESELEHLIIYSSTAYGAMVLGLVAALLVADRLERDECLGMVELQHSTPQKNSGYVLGKFLGNCTAMFVPLSVIYLLCGLTAVLLGWPPVLILKYMLTFLLVTVPSSAAAVGLILLLTSFLPLRIVQVGFVLLWFECYIGLGWHGLAASIFNVGGMYVYAGFFPTPPPRYAVFEIESSAAMALLNIAALLLTGAVALALTYASLAFQRYRAERVQGSHADG
jgi:hypothetical protein